MTVLVTGARGTIGRGVLDALLSAGVPAEQLRAASREPGRLAVPGGVGTVALDLAEPATHPGALDGVDRVFCYAAGDLSAFAAHAHDVGVEHVVLLSSAAVDTEDPGTDPLAAAHAGAERALRDAGVVTTALRPGAFCSNARQWAREIAGDGVVSLPYPRATTAPVHDSDIADVAGAVFTATTGPAAEARGRDVSLSGPESMSFAEQVDVLARELGREIGVRKVDPDAARAEMARRVPAPVVDSLFRLWRESDGVPTRVTGAVEDLTGHPARSFAQWVREHRVEFEA